MVDRSVWWDGELVDLLESGGSSIGPVDDDFPGVGNLVVEDRMTWDGGEWVFTRQGTQTFSYTGGLQPFVVPAGCTSLHAVVAGGSGGTGALGAGGTQGVGGDGAIIEFDLPVTPAETLELAVGGQGGTAIATTAPFGGAGSGGGPGLGGGHGGGASDIRQGGNALADRVAVAGGGGGGGATGFSAAANGGDGGTAGGGNGAAGAGIVGGPGLAGTSGAGGTGGTGSGGVGGSGGSLGTGGNGGGASTRAGGGGGGGGLYGGGGAGGGGGNGSGGGGGGGGSNLVPSGGSITGTNAGDGYITLTWQASIP